MDAQFFIRHYGPMKQLEELKNQCYKLQWTIYRLQIQIGKLRKIFPNSKVRSLVDTPPCRRIIRKFYKDSASAMDLLEQFEQFDGRGTIYSEKYVRRSDKYKEIKDGSSVSV